MSKIKDKFLFTQYSIASSGDIREEASFSLSNNVSSPASITGFAFANASVRSFKAHVSVEIDATADLFEVFEIMGIQRGSDWSMNASSVGDSTGVIFSIDTSGQLKYTCSNYAGFSSGTIRFRAITTSK